MAAEAEHLVAGHQLCRYVGRRVQRRWCVLVVRFGRVSYEDARQVRTSTMFRMQSASKMLTATAVMCAVGDGLVELNVPLPPYLPDISVHSSFQTDAESKITLRLSVSHPAGPVHEAPRGSNYDSSDLSFEDHCASISDTWLLARVGQRYSSSNLASNRREPAEIRGYRPTGNRLFSAQVSR